MKPVTSIDDPRYVKAMSHPLRVRILAILGERTASPSELAGWLKAPLGTVAYHVRTLFGLGLIELQDETRVRGAVEHHYRARSPRPTVSEEAWAAASPVAKQVAAASTLQVIDDYARASAAGGGFDRPEAWLNRRSLRLDGKGWKQLTRACARFVEQVDRIEQAAAERIAEDPHAPDASDAAVVLMAFEAARLVQEEPSQRRTRRPRTAGRAREALS